MSDALPSGCTSGAGAAWGYFILCTWLTYLIADAIVLLISLHVKREHMSLAGNNQGGARLPKLSAVAQPLAGLHRSHNVYHYHHPLSAVALGLFGIQIFSCGYFFGSQRGLQLAVGTLAFSSYAYRGLVKNELTSSAPWGCPQGRYSDILQVSLSRLVHRKPAASHHMFTAVSRQGQECFRQQLLNYSAHCHNRCTGPNCHIAG